MIDFDAELTNRKNAIAAACIGADDAFIMAAIAAGTSAEDASRQWQQKLIAERDKATTAAAAKQRGTQLTAGVPGVDSEEDYGAIVKGFMAKGMTRSQACHKAAKQYPEAHAAFVASCPAPTRKSKSRS